MWGADDPDCRKPIVWDDISYEEEKASFDPARSRAVDIVRQDTSLLSFYKALCRMRNGNKVLSEGDLEFIVAGDEKMVLAYTRSMGDEEIIAVFNRSVLPQTVALPSK
jgi:cyclomaltodextrinase